VVAIATRRRFSIDFDMESLCAMALRNHDVVDHRPRHRGPLDIGDLGIPAARAIRKIAPPVCRRFRQPSAEENDRQITVELAFARESG
jgi:hypothetical protein